MPTPGTPLTAIRFTGADREDIETIREHHGLATIAAVLRKLIKDELTRIARKPKPERIER